jgi:hypothetical protein
MGSAHAAATAAVRTATVIKGAANDVFIHAHVHSDGVLPSGNSKGVCRAPRAKKEFSPNSHARTGFPIAVPHLARAEKSSVLWVPDSAAVARGIREKEHSHAFRT